MSSFSSSTNSVFTVVNIVYFTCYTWSFLEFVPLLKDDGNIILASAVNGPKD